MHCRLLQTRLAIFRQAIDSSDAVKRDALIAKQKNETFGCQSPHTALAMVCDYDRSFTHASGHRSTPVRQKKSESHLNAYLAASHGTFEEVSYPAMIRQNLTNYLVYWTHKYDQYGTCLASRASLDTNNLGRSAMKESVCTLKFTASTLCLQVRHSLGWCL